MKNFIVDLRSTPKIADVTSWSSEPHLMRSRRSTFDASLEPDSFLPYTLSKLYDGLLFIETTSRALPNPSVKNVAGPGNK
jgi:erythromycin esterase